LQIARSGDRATMTALLCEQDQPDASGPVLTTYLTFAHYELSAREAMAHPQVFSVDENAKRTREAFDTLMHVMLEQAKRRPVLGDWMLASLHVQVTMRILMTNMSEMGRTLTSAMDTAEAWVQRYPDEPLPSDSKSDLNFILYESVWRWMLIDHHYSDFVRALAVMLHRPRCPKTGSTVSADILRSTGTVPLLRRILQNRYLFEDEHAMDITQELLDRFRPVLEREEGAG